VIYKENDIIPIEKKEQSFPKNNLIDSKTFEIRVMKIDDPYVKYEIKYPHFLYANRELNNGIKKFIQEASRAHGITSRENWLTRYNTQEEGGFITKVPSSEEEKFYFFVDFEIIQSNSNYISLLLKYGGFSGGAHGYENKSSLAYDVSQKKYLGLKDLFPDNPGYLKTLSVISRDKLKDQLVQSIKEGEVGLKEESLNNYANNIVSAIELGTEPKEENFNTYTFTPDKIKVYFAQYQVGPYSIGMPEIEIDR